MLDAMVEGVLLLDSDGRIVLGNPAFALIFDATGPLEGRRPLEAARIGALQEAVDAALVSAEPVMREITLPGEPARTIQASLAAVREAGGVVGAVAVFHDVTEIKTLERVRREFVANVSHELRTPLTAIKGYAETLLGGGLEDRARAAQFVEVIARHAERLRGLIEDLLDLAAVEQREARLSIGPVDVGEVAAQAEAVLKPAAAARDLALAVDVPGGLPQVLADRDRLAQILINLLDNAVKFTPPAGRVEVSARAAGDNVVIAVRDTGIGIPPAEIGRIFERFYRVDRSRDRREGGTGLGLAIAKHLVLAMDGTIEVESVPGAGATFRVTLPAAS
jgi:two-component system phosphate regulon sensor histidine kinase PhoR